MTIIDTVDYKNLEAGQRYHVIGVLMDKETGKELLIDGKKVTAEASFKAEKANGTVDVTFVFNGERLTGHELVVFEKLFAVNGELEIEVTSHEDLEDEGQTVKMVEKETPKPVKDTPKTGDNSNVGLWIAISALAASGLVLIKIWKMHRKKRED